MMIGGWFPMVAKKLTMCIGVKPFRTRSYRSPLPSYRKKLPYTVENAGNKKSPIFVIGISKHREFNEKGAICRFSSDGGNEFLRLVKSTRRPDSASLRPKKRRTGRCRQPRVTAAGERA